MSFSEHAIRTVALDTIGRTCKTLVFNWPGKLVASFKPWPGDSYKVPVFELRDDDVPITLFQQDWLGIRIGAVTYRLYIFSIDSEAKAMFAYMIDQWLVAARHERYMELL